MTPNSAGLSITCDPSKITAAILVGGQGTRLRSVVADRPKPLAAVSERPFLCYLLDQLHRQGVRRAVLCTGYRANQIESELGASYKGLQLEYSVEADPLGTAGALRQALERLGSDPVLVLNGDSYCDFKLRPFLAWHQARRAVASLWLTRVENASRFGVVQTVAGNAVTQFVEKQATSKCATDLHWINAGVYLLSQRLLQSIEPNRKVSLERTVFPDWIGRGLYGFHGDARFLDIGTPQTYESAAEFFRRADENQRSVHPPSEQAGGRRRFVILDRDGVINVERHYLSDPEQVELIPGAAEGLKRLRDLGLGLVVVTNQSGVGRGYFDEATLARIHSRLRELLSAAGVKLDGIYYCPHRPDGECACRKPAAGLVLQAAREHHFDPAESFLVGDKKCDIDLGKRVGATTFLVLTGHGGEAFCNLSVEPNYVASSLEHAAAIIADVVEGTYPLDSGIASHRQAATNVAD